MHRLRSLRPRVPGRGHLSPGQRARAVEGLHRAKRRNGDAVTGHHGKERAAGREVEVYPRLAIPRAVGLDEGMKARPLRTTVIGSYPFPGWLEFASQHLDRFGSADLAE